MKGKGCPHYVDAGANFGHVVLGVDLCPRAPAAGGTARNAESTFLVPYRPLALSFHF